jgi:hypothetical protein
VGEQEFIDGLFANGWSAEWVTILEQDAAYQPPTQEDAAAWASAHALDPATVLYDEGNVWVAEAVPDAYPMVYLEHTSNMLIWARYMGWWYTEHAEWPTFFGWWLDIIDSCAAQPGAIAE